MRSKRQSDILEDQQQILSRQGRASRRRGAGGERELCALLNDAFGTSCKRLLGQARDSGHDIDLPPFRIECKRRKRIANLYEWLEQADTVLQARPVVMLRADGKGWLVVMRLEDWATIAREEIAAQLPQG